MFSYLLFTSFFFLCFLTGLLGISPPEFFAHYIFEHFELQRGLPFRMLIEWTAAIYKIFSAVDIDGNGRVSISRLLLAAKAHSEMKHYLEQVLAGHSQSSQSQLPPPLRRQIEKISFGQILVDLLRGKGFPEDPEAAASVTTFETFDAFSRFFKIEAMRAASATHPRPHLRASAHGGIEVAADPRRRLLIVLFSAQKSRRCAQIESEFRRLARDADPNAMCFVKLTVPVRASRAGRTVLRAHAVAAVPTVNFYKGGQVVFQVRGFNDSKMELLQMAVDAPNDPKPLSLWTIRTETHLHRLRSRMHRVSGIDDAETEAIQVQIKQARYYLKALAYEGTTDLKSKVRALSQQSRTPAAPVLAPRAVS